jgi:hypothetical protein
MKGGPAELRGRHIAVSNAHIHQPLLELFGEVFAGQYRFALPQVNAD